MADVTYRAPGEPETTRYAALRRLSDGKFRLASGGTHETYDASHWAQYAHELEDVTGTGQFELTVDLTGEYWLADYQQAGETPDLDADGPSLYDLPQFNSTDATGSSPPSITVEQNEIEGT